jgi:hypothetical protein
MARHDRPGQTDVLPWMLECDEEIQIPRVAEVPKGVREQIGAELPLRCLQVKPS